MKIQPSLIFLSAMYLCAHMCVWQYHLAWLDEQLAIQLWIKNRELCCPY